MTLRPSKTARVMLVILTTLLLVKMGTNVIDTSSVVVFFILGVAMGFSG